MNVCKCVIVIACLAMMSGCQVVTCEKPIGNTPVELDPETLDGDWYVPGNTDVYRIKVIDAKNGVFESYELDENNQIRPRDTLRVTVRSAHGWTFASAEPIGKEKEEKEKDKKDQVKEYLWGRIKIEPDLILVWEPKTEKFVELVEKKLLPGEVTATTLGKISDVEDQPQKESGEKKDVGPRPVSNDNKNVRLKPLNDEQLKLITSDKHGMLYEWDEPLVLVRMPKELMKLMKRDK